MRVYTSADIPKTIEDAIRLPEWNESVQRELNALLKMKAWKETNIEDLTTYRLINGGYDFRVKENGTLKTRIVAKDYAGEMKREDRHAPMCSTTKILVSAVFGVDMAKK